MDINEKDIAYIVRSLNGALQIIISASELGQEDEDRAPKCFVFISRAGIRAKEL